MIYKCPNCNGALEYDPAEDKMYCAHCGNAYFMWELDEDAVEYHQELPTQSEIEEEKKLDFTKDRTIYDEPEFIECKVYTCSTCGAELSVSDKEVSTYCAYCGQPTIVYNRVDKTQKPKYIIPFKITKEEAETAIREKLKKGFFIPKEVKNFEAERITGIYLPYFLYDLTFYQKTKVSYRKSDYSDIVEGDCNFIQVCQDASKSVEDELSYALEPYDLTELKDFEPGYLSGFYADRFDLSPRQMVQTVGRRCKKMFDDELSRRCEGKVVDLPKAPYQYAITKVEYTFMPVWFMTFRYQNIPYTMMVNGQTGKVVGTVPFARNRVVIVFMLLTLLFSIPLVIFGWWIYQMPSYNIGFYIFPLWMMICMFLLPLLLSVVPKYKLLKENLKHARNRKTENFVKKRQGKNI